MSLQLSRWHVLSFASILLILLIFAVSIETYPAPSCDESGYGASAFALREHGQVNWSPLLPAGDPAGRDLNMATHGRLYALGLAATFQLFGLSLWSARLFSILGWGLAAVLTYKLGARVFNRTVGVSAALLFATTTKSLLTAHTARPETWTTAAVLLAVWLSLNLVLTARGRLGYAFFIGVLLVVPGDFHGNGFAFTSAISIALAVELGLRQKRWREIVAIGAGLLLALILWVLIHLNATIANLGQLLLYTTLADAGSSLGLWERLVSFVEWLRLAFWVAGGLLSLLELLLALAGLAAAVRHGAPARNWITAIALGSLGIFALVFSQRFIQYAILWSPFWFVLGAATLHKLVDRLTARKIWNNSRESVFALITGAFLSVQLAGDLWLIYRYRDGEYRQTFHAVAAVIPTETRVVADMTWWWALRDRRTFLADEYFFFINESRSPALSSFLSSNEKRISNIDTLMEHLTPEYIVLDRATGCYQEPGPEWFEVAAYVQEQCTLVEEIAGAWLDDEDRRTSQFAQLSSVYKCTSAG